MFDVSDKLWTWLLLHFWTISSAMADALAGLDFEGMSQAQAKLMLVSPVSADVAGSDHAM